MTALGDDDDNSGQASHKINDYASSRFTYYTTDVKTCNTGAGTAEDPKCVTVWALGGEDLNTKYGGGNANEIVDGRPMVKTGTVGGCARCGGVQGVTFEYHYMNIINQTPDDNEVSRIVVEDTIDAKASACGCQCSWWNLSVLFMAQGPFLLKGAVPEDFRVGQGFRQSANRVIVALGAPPP